ncbi:MAG: hypothetical protein HC828_16705 [Blastochloris sp.]|nr:hypothetical protein [Blastochloris sp.]
MQEFAERGQRAVHDVQEKAQETPMLRDAQETLARMIAQASVQLGEFAERMRASAQNTPPASQDIPIDDESDKPGSDPTTGPTTRL